MSAAGATAFIGFGPLALVAAWSAGRRIEGLGRAAGVFALAYGLSLGLTVLQEVHSSLSLLLFVGLFLLVAIIVPGIVGRYWSQRRTLSDTVQEYNAQLVRERAMIASHARIRERQRIAQDMHDSLGHQLALIAVHTGALEVDRELTGQQREGVGVLREASVAAMHELRDVVGVLRDGADALHRSRTRTARSRDTVTRGGGHRQPGRNVPERGRDRGTAVLGRGTPARTDRRPCGVPRGPGGLTNAHKHARVPRSPSDCGTSRTRWSWRSPAARRQSP
ncbi:histidine kinase dimerization/phosphoacceptor domain-containing protein [Streptomyces sp. M10(2022)]